MQDVELFCCTKVQKKKKWIKHSKSYKNHLLDGQYGRPKKPHIYIFLLCYALHEFTLCTKKKQKTVYQVGIWQTNHASWHMPSQDIAIIIS